MASVADRIKQAREKSGITQVDLAVKIGVSKQTLYKYENGVITNIPSDKIEQIAELTGVSPAYLMGWVEDTPSDLPSNVLPITKKKFPLLGSIACGEPIFADEDFEGYVEAGANIDADFCLRANGDSMIGARIHDGDIVFIKQQPLVENGQIAAVLIDDEATLKRFYYDKANQIIQLMAENPAYPPIIKMQTDLESIRILGRAIAFQSNIK